jgi:hypothetical protein
MKITKSELEVMMQEEVGKLTPRTAITSNELREMMQEELAIIDEAQATGYDLNKQISSALDKLENGDHRGAGMILYDVLENLESDDPQHNPTVGVGGFDDEGYSTIAGSRPMQEGRYSRSKSESDDPRAQAFEQAITLLDDLQYDSLEDDVSSYADDAVRAMSKALEELDYKRNQVGNDPDADAARKLRDPYGAPMRETRKHPLKRDSEKFARNTDMVSGLQKTITNYLKEAGVKIKPRHTKAVEKMSTRLMHVANSPMIRLEEGIHYEGLMENITDILRDELGSWHQEAKDSLKQEIESQGFDLTQQILALIVAPL